MQEGGFFMFLIDSGYYKRFLDSDMEDLEFRKRLLVALEQEKVLRPEQYQLICEGKDEAFLNLVKEEYRSALDFVASKEAAIEEEKALSLEDITEETEVGEDTEEDAELIEESDAEVSDIEDTYLEDKLKEEERLAHRKEKTLKARKQQQTYRDQYKIEEARYQSWLSLMEKANAQQIKNAPDTFLPYEKSEYYQQPSYDSYDYSYQGFARDDISKFHYQDFEIISQVPSYYRPTDYKVMEPERIDYHPSDYAQEKPAPYDTMEYHLRYHPNPTANPSEYDYSGEAYRRKMMDDESEIRERMHREQIREAAQRANESYQRKMEVSLNYQSRNQNGHLYLTDTAIPYDRPPFNPYIPFQPDDYLNHQLEYEKYHSLQYRNYDDLSYSYRDAVRVPYKVLQESTYKDIHDTFHNVERNPHFSSNDFFTTYSLHHPLPDLIAPKSIHYHNQKEIHASELKLHTEMNTYAARNVLAKPLQSEFLYQKGALPGEYGYQIRKAASVSGVSAFQQFNTTIRTQKIMHPKQEPVSVFDKPPIDPARARRESRHEPTPRDIARIEKKFQKLHENHAGSHNFMRYMNGYGFQKVSNRVQNAFRQYMNSSIYAGDETSDALSIKYRYGSKIRLATNTGKIMSSYALTAGQSGDMMKVFVNDKYRADKKELNSLFKGQSKGFTLNQKLNHLQKEQLETKRLLTELSPRKKLSANERAAYELLKNQLKRNDVLARDLNKAVGMQKEMAQKYWRDRNHLQNWFQSNKKNLSVIERQMGVRSLTDKQISKEISLLRKKRKLGILSSDEARKLEQFRIGLFARKYRQRQLERRNSRRNFSYYLYYGLRGNNSYHDQAGLYGAVRIGDFANNYYVKRTLISFYKLSKRSALAGYRVGKGTAKAVWGVVAKTPTGMSIDGSVIMAKAKMNAIKKSTEKFAKRQFWSLANTKPGIGLRMNYLNVKPKFVKTSRFFKRAKDKTARIYRIVTSPFRFLQRGLNLIRSVLYKLGAVVAGIVIALFVLMVIFEIGGAALSIIMAPNETDDGLIDLTEYIECLEEKQEEFIEELDDRADGDYTKVTRSYSREDNTKEILSMMAVRLDQDLGEFYHKTYELDECDNHHRDKCKGHREDLEYIELLYDLSHIVSTTESEPYYCKDMNCKTRTVTTLNPTEEGRGFEMTEEEYCPGDHVDLLISTEVLRFDEIFSVDTIDSEGEITAKKGEYIGTFTVTAYCSCEECCGENASGKTSTGVKPKENRTIAVDPDVIPYGTVVVIGKKAYVAEDTGGAIKGKRIDIYFKDHEDAKKFGKKKYKVYLGTDVGTKNNDSEYKKDKWEGWTEDNREWAKSIYNQKWDELYEGYKELTLDFSDLAIEVKDEDFDKILEILDSKVGCSYVWGATGPDTFDCSGLVMYVYEKAGVYDWGGARPTTETLYKECVPVSAKNAKQGDLVLWDVPGDIHHVGIYCGAGVVCHAPKPGDVVKYSKLWGNYGFFRLPK